jgi:hypothetical protein
MRKDRNNKAAQQVLRLSDPHYAKGAVLVAVFTVQAQVRSR